MDTACIACTQTQRASTHLMSQCHTPLYHIIPLVLHTAPSCLTFTPCAPRPATTQCHTELCSPQVFPTSSGPLPSIVPPGPHAAALLSCLDDPCYHPRLSQLLRGSHTCGLVVCGHTPCSKVHHTPMPTYCPPSSQALCSPALSHSEDQEQTDACTFSLLKARDRKDEQETMNKTH